MCRIKTGHDSTKLHCSLNSSLYYSILNAVVKPKVIFPGKINIYGSLYARLIACANVLQSSLSR